MSLLVDLLKIGPDFFDEEGATLFWGNNKWTLPMRLTEDANTKSVAVTVDVDPPSKRRRITSIDEMSEVDVWRVMHTMAKASITKHNTAGAEHHDRLRELRKETLKLIGGPAPHAQQQIQQQINRLEHLHAQVATMHRLLAEEINIARRLCGSRKKL